MSKDTEEILIIAVVGFVLLSLVKGGGLASSQAKIDAATNTAYAGDVTSIINNAFDDWS